MKKYLFYIVLAFALFGLTWAYLIFGGTAEENSNPVQLEIKQVTVYPKGAKLRGSVQMNLKTGDTTLLLSGIPNLIDEASIQIFTEADVDISEVKFKLKDQDNRPNVLQTNPLNDSLRILQDSLKKTQFQIEALKKEEALLFENKNFAFHQEKSPAEQLKDLSAFLKKRFVELQTEKEILNQSLEKFEKKALKITEQIQASQKQKGETQGQILVKLNCAKPTKAIFEVSFLAEEASWKPTYELRAKTEQATAQLRFKAQIIQNTGLDWKNIKLSLSTENPQTNPIEPTLNPMLLTLDSQKIAPVQTEIRIKDSISVQKDTLQIKKDTLSIKKDSIAIPKKDSIVADYATEFEIEKTQSILSNNKIHYLTLASPNLPVTFHFKAIPSLDKNVFISAFLSDWRQYKFPKGEINTYANGAFLGKSLMNFESEDDTLRLALGKDKKISVSHLESRKDSLAGNQIIQQFTYQIKLANPYTKVSQISIIEPFPISQNPQIQVKILEAEKAEIDNTKALATWKIALNPSEKRELLLRYEITFPKEEKLIFVKK